MSAIVQRVTRLRDSPAVLFIYVTRLTTFEYALSRNRQDSVTAMQRRPSQRYLILIQTGVLPFQTQMA